jgi:PAS domain S-box-containing protein
MKKDGSPLPVTMHIAWINRDNGAPLCIVISLRTSTEPKAPEKQSERADGITAQKEPGETAAEAAAPAVQPTPLKLDGHPLSSALENTATALILVDQDTVILACNTAFEILSGFPRAEIEGKKSWMDFVAREDQPRLKRYYLLRRLDPASSPSTYEFKFAASDGSTRDVLINISSVPGSRHLAATLLDLAEYKQAAAGVEKDDEPASVPEIQPVTDAMPVSPSAIFQVLELSPNSIVVTDIEGKIVFLSPTALKNIWPTRSN